MYRQRLFVKVIFTSRDIFLNGDAFCCVNLSLSRNRRRINKEKIAYRDFMTNSRPRELPGFRARLGIDASSAIRFSRIRTMGKQPLVKILLTGAVLSVILSE